MESFETPGPVQVAVECAAGEVVVTTHDDPRTEVELVPLRDDEASRSAVERARVELLARGAGDRVVVEVPERTGVFHGREPRVRVEVRAPHGTALTFTTASAEVVASGRLGEVRGKTASGDVTLPSVDAVEVKTASGEIRVGDVAGRATLQSASGDVRVGAVGGPLDANVVSGSLVVEAAEAGGAASAVSGDIELAAVTEGEVSIRTVSGDVTVGVREGSRVHVDVSTLSGDLRSDLDLSDSPDEGGDGPLVEVRGKTVSGDLRVRRAPAPALSAS